MFRHSLKGDSQQGGRDGNDGSRTPGDEKKSVADIVRRGQREGLKKEIRTRQNNLEQWYGDLTTASFNTGDSMKRKITDWRKTCSDGAQKEQIITSQWERIETLKGYHQNANNAFRQELQGLQANEYSSYALLRNHDLKDYQAALTRWEERKIDVQRTQESAWKQLDADVAWELGQHSRMEALGKQVGEIKQGLTHLVGWDAHYRKLAVSNIDAWEKVTPSDARMGEMRRGVEELYRRHDQTPHFEDQWHRLKNREFSADELRANHYLIAYETLLSRWQRDVDALGPIYMQDWTEQNQRLRQIMQEETGARQFAFREWLNKHPQSLEPHTSTQLGEIYEWEHFRPGAAPAERMPLANILRGRIQAMHDIHTQIIQTEKSDFEQALQNLGNRRFRPEDIESNRDIIEHVNILDTHNRRAHIATSLHTKRYEHTTELIDLKENLASAPPANEGGTREQRLEAIKTQQRALKEQFKTLTTSVSNYYRNELEKSNKPGDLVRTLRDIQTQDIKENNNFFNLVLDKFNSRHFTPKEVGTNRDLVARAALLTRWQEHIATLGTIHEQERSYANELQPIPEQSSSR